MKLKTIKQNIYAQFNVSSTKELKNKLMQLDYRVDAKLDLRKKENWLHLYNLFVND
jgi:hypothetical protein